MKKLIALAILVLVFATIIGGVMTASVSADENYNDISNEYGEDYRPEDIPEDGMNRLEPRTRFKDR